MKRTKHYVFIIAGSILCALAIAEIGLRIIPVPALTYTNGIYDFPCYTKTKDMWLVLKKNAHCTLRSNIGAFGDIPVSINSLGLRNVDITFPKPPMQKRIVFLGDSFTFGFGVLAENAYPARIQDFLRRQQSVMDIEIVNAGIPVVGSGRYYIRLAAREYTQDADIIVVGLYIGNDLYDNEIQPRWIDDNKDGYPERIESQTAHVDTKGNLVSNDRPWFLEIPYISDLKIIHAFAYLYVRLPWKNTSISMPLLSKRLCLYYPNCHDFDDEILKRKDLYLEMQKIATERKQKLLFVLIPTEFQVYPESRWKYQIPIALSPTQRNHPNRSLATFFQTHDIQYLDLLPVFASASGQPYFAKDEHWNETGHAIAATAIGEKLTNMLTP